MYMFLTKCELQQLTSYKYYTKQIKWLLERGFKFEVGADGQPKVLRSFVESILGSNNRKRIKINEPDFDALRSL